MPRSVNRRDLSVRVKTARGRKISSTRWLQRQLNDPYVAEARRRGYRSRAAFKLIELDDRFQVLKPGARVLDLGAAPGGWSQVAVERVGPSGRVVAVDIRPMEPLPDVAFIEADITEAETDALVREALGGAAGGKADVVLSDMASSATGHAATDHLRTMALVEAALDCARGLLAPGGAFVAKVLQGGTQAALLAAMKRDFERVKHAKPPASRTDSSEMYVVATGYRGAHAG
ncbi:MAG: RlmE family RNA methyltransferase [Alphaproteobacteria bacterium]